MGFDASKYAGKLYTRLAELQEDGPIKIKIAKVTEDESKFNEGEKELVVHATDGRLLTLNADRTRTLITMFSTDTDRWLDQEIMVYAGKVSSRDAVRIAKPGSKPDDLYDAGNSDDGEVPF